MILSPPQLHELLGNIDIYLLDQILKGQFQSHMKILDAGCGEGRNAKYFLKNNFQLYGVDQDKSAINSLVNLSSQINAGYGSGRFEVATLDNLPFESRYFDAIVCSAVLHFARDENHFKQMVKEMWRVLKYGGFFFCRLASNIGIEKLVKPIGNGRFQLSDGSIRFLVDEKMIVDITEELGGVFMEAIKTVNVQNSRCMTNWIVSKVL